MPMQIQEATQLLTTDHSDSALDTKTISGQSRLQKYSWMIETLTIYVIEFTRTNCSLEIFHNRYYQLLTKDTQIMQFPIKGEQINFLENVGLSL